MTATAQRSEAIERIRVLRSKNAGPFALTFDIVLRGREDFERVVAGLRPELVARAYAIDPTDPRNRNARDIAGDQDFDSTKGSGRASGRWRLLWDEPGGAAGPPRRGGSRIAMTAAATILTPTGCIGNRGIDRRILRNAIIAERPDAIAVDAGSADCGPWYLGAGKEHSPRRNIEWDLEAILSEAVPRGIRVIIGSAGGSGARPHVRDAEDAICRIAKRIGLKFRLASIYADVEQRYLLDRAAGAVVRDARRVPDGAPLTADDVRSTEVIVGMMGTGPIIAALEDGAEVVLAGRAVDAAVIASYPIWRGCAPGLAYHMGDIMECAESCAVEIEPSLRTMGRNRIPIIGRIDEGGFSIRPAAKTLAYTPESCLMHSAYERTDLFSIKVPEGTIDRSHSRYESEGKNGTRISGTSFVPEPLSILFEECDAPAFDRSSLSRSVRRE